MAYMTVLQYLCIVWRGQGPVVACCLLNGACMAVPSERERTLIKFLKQEGLEIYFCAPLLTLLTRTRGQGIADSQWYVCHEGAADRLCTLQVSIHCTCLVGWVIGFLIG